MSITTRSRWSLARSWQAPGPITLASDTSSQLMPTPVSVCAPSPVPALTEPELSAPVGITVYPDFRRS